MSTHAMLTQIQPRVVQSLFNRLLAVVVTSNFYDTV